MRISFVTACSLKVFLALNHYPGFLGEGVDVRSCIASFEITRSGSYGTNPAAVKLFLIVSGTYGNKSIEQGISQ